MITIQKDKQLHFISSFAISFLFAVIFLLCGFSIFEMSIASFSVAFSAGLGKEYADHVNPNNKWDWYDILFDFLGSLLGLVIPLVIKLIL